MDTVGDNHRLLPPDALVRPRPGPARPTMRAWCCMATSDGNRLRASLMYWAARAAGVQAREYVGSWQDWQRNSENPVVR
jgi:hypothetical protein